MEGTKEVNLPNTKLTKEKKGTQVSAGKNFCAKASEAGPVTQATFMTPIICIWTNLMIAESEVAPLMTDREAR